MSSLLAFALVAGSLLFAESLAIYQSPLHDVRRGRRSPRLGNNQHSLTPPSSILVALSQSSTSAAGEGVIDATSTSSHDDNAASIQNTSHSSKKADVSSAPAEEIVQSIWPQMDDLDKRMMKIALPCIANFAINPLVGAVDLFWVNRMGNALAVAGQSAANQVFSSAFWIVSVLPSVTATLVSKANASGNQDELQDSVSQALVVGFLISVVGSKLFGSVGTYYLIVFVAKLICK